jgi:hypothetical protein
LDIVLTILQTISVIVLTILGFLPHTRSSKSEGLNLCGWVLLIVGSSIFILTTITKEIETRKTEEILHKQMEEVRERLFNVLAPRVMETPKKNSYAPVPEAAGQIQIKSPHDGSDVHARAYIEGTVSDPQAEVWVVVHPMETSAYWVQPTVTVKKDGTWKVMIYIGRAGGIDIGKKFEIMAVASTKKKFQEADVLDRWPEANRRSDLIVLTRK